MIELWEEKLREGMKTALSKENGEEDEERREEREEVAEGYVGRLLKVSEPA